MRAQAARPARWSDAKFRTKVLQPARAELVKYLQSKCGHTLLTCIAREKSNTDKMNRPRAQPLIEEMFDTLEKPF